MTSNSTQPPTQDVIKGCTVCANRAEEADTSTYAPPPGHTHQGKALHKAHDTNKRGQDAACQHQDRVRGHKLAEPRPR
jgi:hypothetical protein